MMLEKHIQIAFHAAQIKPLPRRERSTSREDYNDDRDNRIISKLKYCK